jgi:aspartyl-tRNA(Asn)/glutamyl-tRNA(Gln) amidotransferase subunit B
VLNRRVVELAVRAGVALGATIRERSVFARKSYFYPDLPKGYQISQHDLPICEGGELEIEVPDTACEGGVSRRRIALQRIHLEEDAGKSFHRGACSSVNLNRAGVPLIEIVSAPELRSAAEAGAYLRALHALVTFLGISDGNMQEGNFRCDANVSVRPRGSQVFGTRVEIKNVNSFRFVEKAIEHEISRQVRCILAGGKVVQETRLYDSERDLTAPMRSKEEARDYRYFPDPDLMEVRVDSAWVEAIRGALPESPAAKRDRYVRELGLGSYDAGVLCSSPELAAYFEKSVAAGAAGSGSRALAAQQAKSIANLITGELLRRSNEEGVPLSGSRVTPDQVARVAELARANLLSSTGVKRALQEAWRTGEPVDAIIEREGLRQVSDVGALEPLVDEVLAAHPAQFEELRAGKEKVLGFLVGQLMRKSGGKANPALLQQLIRRKAGLA